MNGCNECSNSSGFRSPMLMPSYNLHSKPSFSDEGAHGLPFDEPCCWSVLGDDTNIIKREESCDTQLAGSKTVAETHELHQTYRGEDVDQPFIENGVADFLDDVITGRTDHLRKLLAHQTLETVTAATTRAQNNSVSEVVTSPSESLAGTSSTGGSVSCRKVARDHPISSAARSLQAYELVAYIGSGTFSEVTLARHKVNNELYAIKKISKEKVRKGGFVEHTFMERKMLVALHHPFLVRLYQAFQTRTHLYLVLDFAQGGDLYYFNLEKRWVKEMKYEIRRSRYPCCMSQNLIDPLGRTLTIERSAASVLSGHDGNFHTTGKSMNVSIFESTNNTIRHISPQTVNDQEEDVIAFSVANDKNINKESAHTKQQFLKKTESPSSLSISNRFSYYQNYNLACEHIGTNSSAPPLYRYTAVGESEKRAPEDQRSLKNLPHRDASIGDITERVHEAKPIKKHQHYHHYKPKEESHRDPLFDSHEEEHNHRTHSLGDSQQYPNSKALQAALDPNMVSEDSVESYCNHARRSFGSTNAPSRVADAHFEVSVDATSLFSSAPLLTDFSPHVQDDGATECVHEDMEGSTVAMPPLADNASRLPIRYIAFYAIEIALVLQYLHSKGFIYRDLKPENILLRQSGHILLTDFGVAKLRKNTIDDSDIMKKSNQSVAEEESGVGRVEKPISQTSPSCNGEFSASSDDNAEERATSFTGTVEYMSPEMLQGIPHDTRTDWWSYGCLLFEWANGRKPFDGDSQFALFKSIIEENVRVIETDFQVTALELHCRVEKLRLRYQELVCEHKLSTHSHPQEEQKTLPCGDSLAHTSATDGETEGASIQTGQRQNIHSYLLHSFHSVSSSTDRNPQIPSWAGTPVEAHARRSQVFATRKQSVSSTSTLLGTHSTPLTMAPRVCDTFVRHALMELLEANLLLRDLILGLLNRDMGKRLCGPMVLEHPFFACRYITSQLYDSVYPTRGMRMKGTNNVSSAFGRTSEIPQREEQIGSIVFSSTSNVMSAEMFLERMPVIQRPENWAELFSTMKIKALYVPKLRSRDDLRYFPSAVTATGLRAAVEQHKRIKEARNEMKELRRQTMRQVVTHSYDGDTKTCLQHKKHEGFNLNVQGTSDELLNFDPVLPHTSRSPGVMSRLCHNVNRKDNNTDLDGNANATAAFDEEIVNTPDASSPHAFQTQCQPSSKEQSLGVDDFAQLAECSSNFCCVSNPKTVVREAVAIKPSSSHHADPPLLSAQIQPSITGICTITDKDFLGESIAATADALEDNKGSLNVGKRQCGIPFALPKITGTQRRDVGGNCRSFSLGTVGAGGVDAGGSFSSGDPLCETRGKRQKSQESATIGYPSRLLIDDSDISKTSTRGFTSEDIFARTAVLPEDFVAAAIVAGQIRMEQNKNPKGEPPEVSGSSHNPSLVAEDDSEMLPIEEANGEERSSAPIHHDSSGGYYDCNATEETPPMMDDILLHEGFTTAEDSKDFHCMPHSGSWSGENKGEGLHVQCIKPKKKNTVSTETASLEDISDEVSGLSTFRLLDGASTHHMKREHPLGGKGFIGDDENNSSSCDHNENASQKDSIVSATKSFVDEVEHDRTQSSISGSSSGSGTSSESLFTGVSMDLGGFNPAYSGFNHDVHRTSRDIYSSNKTVVPGLCANTDLETFSRSGDCSCNFVNGRIPVHSSNSSLVAKHGPFPLHQLNANVDAAQGMTYAQEPHFNEPQTGNSNLEDSALYTQNEEMLRDGLTHPTWGVILGRVYADAYQNDVTTLHGIAYDVDDESASSMTIGSRAGAHPSSPKLPSSLLRVREGTSSGKSIRPLKPFQTEGVSRSYDFVPSSFSGSLSISKIDVSSGNAHMKPTKNHCPSASPRELWQKRMRQRTATPSSPAIEESLPNRKQSVEFLGFTYDGHAFDGGFLDSANTTLTTNFFDDNENSDSLSAMHTTSIS
ncbi:unnamed protein product [Phytomonas sp. EM1]|nr:unnamed protein product [Phytomonas sp. EM1]|eukprot:CCW61456.1 unnamed protein product [Phytomonas sp. isolate EM1]